ncbi:hypothetical protein pb186bvf_000564 [Paramecium bursaria]
MNYLPQKKSSFFREHQLQIENCQEHRISSIRSVLKDNYELPTSTQIEKIEKKTIRKDSCCIIF